MKAILLCLSNAGITCMIVRKTFPELISNHVNPMVQMLNCYAPNRQERIASYNDAKKTITFPNGSHILFRYCDNDKDAEKFQGTETDVLFIDEATHQTEERVKKLIACVRGANAFPKRIYMTANPGSVGHAWFKRLFIDRAYESNENPEDYMFIQSLVTDNVALMRDNPDYLSQLEALPSKLRKMWLEGDWNVAEGVFFEEFRDDPEHYEDRRWTHVIEPFDIPKSWRIYMSYDFGYSKPFSFQWWAVDHDGRVYLIVEMYGCTGEPNEGVKWIAEEQFKKVRDIEATHPLLKGRKIYGRVADPAIWKAESGESVAETAANYQIYFEKADNARISGWMQMHYYMAFDENQIPMMYIFNTCKHFIRTIPLMTYSETIPEDLDTNLEDHIADSTRYFLQSRPIKPRTSEAKKELEFDPLNLGKKKSNKYTYINV